MPQSIAGPSRALVSQQGQPLDDLQPAHEFRRRVPLGRLDYHGVPRAQRHALRRPHASRQRVLDAVGELGYQSNAAARSLRSGRRRIVGLLVTNLHNGSFASLLEDTDLVMAHAGYSIIVSASRAELLIQRMTGGFTGPPRRVTVPAQATLRRSTGPAPP